MEIILLMDCRLEPAIHHWLDQTDDARLAHLLLYVRICAEHSLPGQFLFSVKCWTPGLGIGYEVLERHDVEWGVDVGAGYQYTRYDQVAVGDDMTVGGASFLAGTRLSWELTKKLDFDLQYNAMVGLSNYVSTNHHALAQLSYDS